MTDEARARAEEGACPSCGGGRGKIISNDQLEEGMGAGAIWNIDPKTGGPAKEKR